MSHSSCAWKAAQALPRLLARLCFLLPLIPLTSQNPNEALGGATTHPSCPFSQKLAPVGSKKRAHGGKSPPASFPRTNHYPKSHPSFSAAQTRCCRRDAPPADSSCPRALSPFGITEQKLLIPACRSKTSTRVSICTFRKRRCRTARICTTRGNVKGRKTCQRERPWGASIPGSSARVEDQPSRKG